VSTQVVTLPESVVTPSPSCSPPPPLALPRNATVTAKDAATSSLSKSKGGRRPTSAVPSPATSSAAADATTPAATGACESCGTAHDRTYGSGRFCSVHCARRVAAGRKWANQRNAQVRFVLRRLSFVVALGLDKLKMCARLVGGGFVTILLAVSVTKVVCLARTTSFAACSVTDSSHFSSGPINPFFLVSVHPPTWTVSLFRPVASCCSLHSRAAAETGGGGGGCCPETSTKRQRRCRAAVATAPLHANGLPSRGGRRRGRRPCGSLGSLGACRGGGRGGSCVSCRRDTGTSVQQCGGAAPLRSATGRSTLLDGPIRCTRAAARSRAHGGLTGWGVLPVLARFFAGGADVAGVLSAAGEGRCGWRGEGDAAAAIGCIAAPAASAPAVVFASVAATASQVNASPGFPGGASRLPCAPTAGSSQADSAGAGCPCPVASARCQGAGAVTASRQDQAVGASIDAPAPTAASPCRRRYRHWWRPRGCHKRSCWCRCCDLIRPAGSRGGVAVIGGAAVAGGAATGHDGRRRGLWRGGGGVGSRSTVAFVPASRSWRAGIVAGGLLVVADICGWLEERTLWRGSFARLLSRRWGSVCGRCCLMIA